jgi:hypothetical protein
MVYTENMEKIERAGFEPDECFFDDDGILRFVVRDEHSLEQNEILNAIIDEMAVKLRSQAKPVLVLVDITNIKEVSFKTKQNIARESSRIDVDGLCYFTAVEGPLISVLKLVLKLYDPNRFWLVDDEALAREWLLNYHNRDLSEDRRPSF